LKHGCSHYCRIIEEIKENEEDIYDLIETMFKNHWIRRIQENSDLIPFGKKDSNKLLNQTRSFKDNEGNDAINLEEEEKTIRLSTSTQDDLISKVTSRVRNRSMNTIH
jgi:hypothetical protein